MNNKEENEITEEIIMLGQEIQFLNEDIDNLREELNLEKAKNQKLLWILGLTNTTSLMEKND